MKWFYKGLSCFFFIVFFIGIGAMDSENLALPVILTSMGLFGLFVSVRWWHEED